MTITSQDQGYEETGTGEGIAVIGLAGRFPQATTAEELWANLCAGKECFEDFTEEELLAAGVPPEILRDPDYRRRGPVLEGIEDFDAEFFGYSPATARSMDPQQRLLLECAWHALEDAGCDPSREERPVGVFAASSYNSYLLYHVLSHRDMRTFVGAGRSTDLIQTLSVNDPNFFATRVSHALDLHGPSLSVQTACSSSLVAVHLACQSLLAGECDIALAGGMTVRVPNRTGYQYDPGSIMSADGSCRPFDAAASGTVFGSGGGVVVLKRLEDALADGDHIRAVVRGSAVNNDGSLKMGYTAPSVGGQAAVVAEALAVAGVDPATIGYIEAHGTGTALGDPVEVAALTQALGPQDGKTCVLSSAKGAIGHLEGASGVTGLITAVLALENRTIPPTAHYSRPNPDLQLDSTPFTIAERPTPWSGDGPRRAGVSSLGVGGTNAHVVLEEAPAIEPAGPDDSPRVLLLSGRDGNAVADQRRLLAAHLERHPDTDLGAAAGTLADGRRGFDHRGVLVARDVAHAAERLTAIDHPLRHESTALADTPSVALIFPGQGAQYPGMAAGLYRDLPRFRAAVDECARLFEPLLDTDIVAAMAGDGMLERTDLVQAALFTVGYALATTFRDWGIAPDAVAGHSIGEYAAAAVAGAMELPDAVRLVAARGRLMRDAPPGAMAGVRLPAEQVMEVIDGTPVDIAAVNDANSCVIAGPEAELERVCAELSRRGAGVRTLRTPHAFHTSAMDDAAKRFAECFTGIGLHAPSLPLLSNVTGTWMTDAEAVDAERWGRQIRRPVRWADSMTALLQTPGRVLVEAGPGRSMAGAAKRCAGWSDEHRAVPVMRQSSETLDDHEVMLLAVGRLWAAGVEIDWDRVLPAPARRRIPLPGYPFQRTRHWIDSGYANSVAGRDSGNHPESSVTDGAVDRTARVPSSPTRSDEGTGRPAEEIIAAVWTELLGVAQVRPEDNFFDLGGDSITATQAAVRARREGVDFAPKELFVHQTLRALAAVARPVKAASPGRPSGPAAPRTTARPAQTTASQAAAPVATDDGPPALTPEQLRILTGRSVRHAVPVLLTVDRAMDATVLESSIGAVMVHHEALRTVLTCQFGFWKQELTAAGAARPVIERLDVPHAAEEEGELPTGLLEDLARAAGQEGGAARAALIDRGPRTPWLVALFVDPALFDRTSARLFADDLADACRQAAAGNDVALTPVAVPWSRWAGHVAGLAKDGSALAAADHWLRMAHGAAGTVATAGSGTGDGVRKAAATTSLDRERTRALRALARERETTPQDVFCAALSVAVHRVTGDTRLLTAVDGTSRTVDATAPELSRTVGRCSTRHPVLLEGGRGLDHALTQAADSRHSLSRQGLDYGILAYLHGPTAGLLTAAPRPDILVSHLGTAASTTRRGLVSPVGPGPVLDHGHDHGLHLTTRIVDGSLQARWEHDDRFTPDFVEVLGRRVTTLVDSLLGGGRPRERRGAKAGGRSTASSISKSDMDVLLTSQSRIRS